MRYILNIIVCVMWEIEVWIIYLFLLFDININILLRRLFYNVCVKNDCGK